MTHFIITFYLAHIFRVRLAPNLEKSTTYNWLMEKKDGEKRV